MTSLRGSLARSRSTRRDKQQQSTKQQSKAGTLIKGRKAQPPLKRRRILHHSSTGSSDDSPSDREDDDDDEPASSIRETDQSSDEHDDPERDSDYVNEKSEEDQTTPRAARTQHRKAALPSSSDVSMSESEGSSSEDTSSPPPKKALTPVEANALRKEQRGTRGAAVKHSEILQKQAKIAARKLRRDIPTLNRFPPSPVKLLPNAGRRGFQVRPDLPNPFSLNLPSNCNSSSSATRHRANGARATATIQAGLRKFAGRMMQRVNTMGISGHSKASAPAMAQASSSSSRPPENLSSSLNGKRKRDDKRRDYPSQSRTSSSSRRNLMDTKTQKRNSAQHAGLQAQERDFSSLQPLRRTRSLARQIEQLGVSASQSYGGYSDDEDQVLFASTSAAPSRRNSGKMVAASASETDDDTESVERSVAEMSLDEITEAGEDEEEPEEDAEEEEAEDAHLLNEASVPQLHRLRKDQLIRLVSGLQHEDDEQDISDFTKDMLVKRILDNREASGADEEDEEAEEDEEQQASEEEEEGPQKHTRNSSTQVLGTRHRANSKNKLASPKHQSKSVPTSSSPRRQGQMNRSKSFSHTFDESSSSASSSSSDGEHLNSPQSASSPQQRRRRTASGVGLGRPKYPNTEKTPGRLRSGKLRQSSTVNSSDAEKENRYHGSHTVPGVRRTTSHALIDEDEDEAPTPIARRTRHRRNVSTVSAASSAGYGDDEDAEGMANKEYRLRKVSLPKRAPVKRGSVIEMSEEESEVDELDEDGDQEEEGSVIEHGDEEEEDDEDEHQDPIDLSTATKAGLLRLRRDLLIQMCQERELEETGTKSDLAAALLDWQAEHGHVESEGDADQSEQSASSSPEDDGEEDEDFEPADVSMESVSSATSVETSSTISSGNRSDTTARTARKETKTQALAKLSNKRQSYDKTSREKPLLLKSPRSKAQLVHSPRPDTPPGSGDAQDNDLELDLESLNLLDKEIHPDKLKRGEKIGSGGFKDVYEGKYRNVKVALADIRGHLTENDIKELGLLRDLRHENIVRFIGVSIPSQKDVPVTIVTELCSNGDLFDYIRNTPAPGLDKILSIMLNIAKGLEYLHKRKPATIHRDMKSSNVLVTARGVAKIADFGLARVRNSTRSIIKSLVGTVNWQAPELWVPHPRYNEKVDVYSAAMVFWECLQWHLSQKRYPFEGMNEHAIYQEVGQKQMRPSTATMRRQWGGEILDLVEKMWAQIPAQRPTMTQVVQELEGLLQAEKARIRASR